MKGKNTIKIRCKWLILPVTKVKNSKKIYNRKDNKLKLDNEKENN